jgi:Tfp pilus assembly protein PilO
VIASSLDIWRQRVWVWGVALGFVVLNCIGLLVYKVGYSDRVTTLRGELRDATRQQDDLRTQERDMNDLLSQARLNREGILRLYSEHFSTRRRRLTGVTAEVQELASRAGLVPRSFNYPEQQIQQYGLIKRSFIFSVDGSYTDLRKFVNLLEISDSFLTLEGIQLNEQVARRTTGGGAGAGAAAFPGAFPGRLSSTPGSSASLSVVRPSPLPAAPGGGGAAPGFGAPSAPGSPLHMSLTISTLFASQEESTDALAPLPGSNVAASPRGRPR